MTVASDGLSGYVRFAPVLGFYGKVARFVSGEEEAVHGESEASARRALRASRSTRCGKAAAIRGGLLEIRPNAPQ